VVTANKTLVAHHGPELRALARRRRTILACEAAVVAGVPFLGSLARRPLLAAAARIAGILNGTSHFVLTALDRGATLPAALDDAVARGFAEPDSAADTSGRDAAEKLTILLHLSGVAGLAVDDLTRRGLDALTPADLAAARRLGGLVKPVALATLEPGRSGAWVGPAFVPAGHLFAALQGVDNALAITSASGQTVTFAGPGAGPDVTAATIVDDIVEATAGPDAVDHGERLPAGIDRAALREPPRTRWFLRVVDGAGEASSITAPQPWAEIARTVEQHRAAGRAAAAIPVLESDAR
jgi:homoserine dehydrogenase